MTEDEAAAKIQQHFRQKNKAKDLKSANRKDVNAASPKFLQNLQLLKEKILWSIFPKKFRQQEFNSRM